MDLKDYLGILWRQKIVGILVGLLFYGIWYFNTVYKKEIPNWIATARTFQAEMTSQEYVYTRFVGESIPPYISLAARLELIKGETVAELAATYLYNGGTFQEEGKERVTIYPHPTIKKEDVMAGLDTSSTEAGQPQMFSISAITLDPQLSVDMANAVAFAFKKYLKDYATQKLEKSKQTIVEMLANAQAKQKREEGALAKIKENIGYDPTATRFEDRIRLLEERKSMLEQRKADAESKITYLKDEIAHEEQRLKDIQAGKGIEDVDVSDIKELKEIKSRIDDEYDKLQELEKRYSFEHPDVKGALQKIAYMQLELDDKKKKIIPQILLSKSKDKIKELKDEEYSKNIEIESASKSIAGIESQLTSKDDQQKARLKERDEYLTQQAKAQEAKNETADYKKALRELEQKLTLMPELLIVENPAKAAIQMERKTKPQVPLMILLSIIAGLSAAYLRDYVDDRIRTSYDVKAYMNWPVVGVIPFIKTETERLIKQAAVKAPVFEVYNRLATILGTLFQKDNAKVMTIISISEKEGKTTIAANIATSFARLGKKTILVDGDMRRPSLHKIFSIDNSHGLSTHLSGKFSARTEISKIAQKVSDEDDTTAELQGIIEKARHQKRIAKTAAKSKQIATPEQKLEIDISAIAFEGMQEDVQKSPPQPELPTFKWENPQEQSSAKPENVAPEEDEAAIANDSYPELISNTAVENLDLIPSGPVPANPVALVESDEMKKLLAYLKNNYDIVVVDSPPMESTTEPLIFSAMVDSTFLVVSCWSTRNYQLTWGKRMLEDVNAKIGGVILNKSTIKQKGYYYYYYDYKYYTERE